jgi:hypothetical protein
MVQIQAVIDQMREEMLQKAQASLRQMVGEPGSNGRFDLKALEDKAQTPEFKAQMAKMQKNVGAVRQQAAQGRQQMVREIGKILSRKQKEAFNRMLGKPFDPTKPGGGDPKAATDTRSTDQPKAESPSGTERTPGKKGPMRRESSQAAPR